VTTLRSATKPNRIQLQPRASGNHAVVAVDPERGIEIHLGWVLAAGSRYQATYDGRDLGAPTTTVVSAAERVVRAALWQR
jgi:hypothetical protein